MLEYVESLSNLSGAQQMQDLLSYNSAHDNDCFFVEDAKSAMKHMNYEKVCDSSGLYGEMIKWLLERVWIILWIS